MRQTNLIRPSYAEGFRCIGSACEDTCCQGWNVPIDEATYEKYQHLPASPLRTLIDASLLVNPLKADGSKPDSFAKIRITESDQCPMLTDAGLCGVQSAYGEGLLSHTCASYPRIVRLSRGIREKALTVSCPEAARIVLLCPDLLDFSQDEDAAVITGPLAEVETAPDERLLQSQFWPIRASVLSLIRNRTYPLWQRLFLLGIFCRRLDSIATGDIQRSVLDFLRDFEATVSTGALRPALEPLPFDRKAQLDVVLRLAGLLLHRSNISPRFVQCIHSFTSGIGNGPEASLDSLTGQYALAHDRYFEPFFAQHPHILENYLINTIIRSQFPFSREGMEPGATVLLSDAYALLTAQFALMKGLLIGVSGHHREAFSTDHVIHTIQTASKHFEHSPEFLSLTRNLLAESQMDGARGLAILLRNTDPTPARPAAPAIHIPTSQSEVHSY